MWVKEGQFNYGAEEIYDVNKIRWQIDCRHHFDSIVISLLTRPLCIQTCYVRMFVKYAQGILLYLPRQVLRTCVFEQHIRNFVIAQCEPLPACQNRRQFWLNNKTRSGTIREHSCQHYIHMDRWFPVWFPSWVLTSYLIPTYYVSGPFPLVLWYRRRAVYIR